MITPTSPRPTKTKHGAPEAAIQSECFVWFWNSYPQYRGLFFAVPNQNERSAYESKQQQLISGARRKALGVVPGVSDSIGLIHNGRYHGFCAECKTATGRQSDVQKEWAEKATLAGYYYFVYRSLDEFKREIANYLSEM